MRSLLRRSLLRAAVDPIFNFVPMLSREPKASIQIERLEPRQLLDAINGSSGDDIFIVEYQNNAIHSVLKNGNTVTFSEPLTINAGGGNDQLIIHFNNTHAAIYSPDPTTPGTGAITQRGRAPITFTSIESHTATDLVKFTLNTPNSVDDLSVQKSSNTDIQITGTSGPLTLPSFTLTSIPKLVLNTALNDSLASASGNDTITIGASSATGVINTKLLINSGLGDNTLNVLGNLTTTINTSFGISGVNLTLNVANSSIVNFLTTQLLKSLSLADTSKVILAAHHYHILATNNLTMSASAVLDMTDNDMVLHSAPGSTNAVNLAAITALLDSGYANGTFNGPGIISSLASADLVLLGATPAPNQPQPADILVKFTYAGDTNLDRQVTISDFIDVASHFDQSGGWGQGDFNYDGNVTIADYITVAQNVNTVQPLNPTVSGPSSWGLDYTLDLSANTTTTEVLGWAIDWGDGEFEAFDGNLTTATHEYDDPGTYVIQASARSTHLSYFTPSKTVNITEQLLAAYILSGPSSVTEGTSITYHSRVLNQTGVPATYSWSVKRNGTTVSNATTPDVTFTASDNGAYTIDLTVSASGYDPVTAPQQSLAVTNVAPALSITGSDSIDEGSPYRLNLSWSDPGSDTMSKWNINWGDGTSKVFHRKPSWAAGSLLAKHTYADGLDSHAISATATDEDGSYAIVPTTDESFGTHGIATLSAGETHLVRPSMTLLPSGRILVAIDQANSTYDFVVMRFNANGTLDNSFGSGGSATVDLGGEDFPTGIAVLSDGQIVVGGYSEDAETGHQHFALARLSASGVSQAYTVTDFGDEYDYVANAITLQPVAGGQKIVLGGYSTNPTNTSATLFCLVRFDTDLNIDTSFGQSGKATVAFASTSRITALAIQNVQDEPRIVAAGYSGSPNTAISLARLLSNGSIDGAFGSGGKVTTSFGTRSLANAVAVYPDGRIAVAGKKDNDFAVVRYTSLGALDGGFNSGSTAGKVSIDFGGGVDLANSLAIDQSRRLIIVGSANGSGDFGIARLNEDGTPDATLTATGKITTALGPGADIPSAVTVRPDGKFVVAGLATSSTGASDIALAAYPFVSVNNVDPQIDLSLTPGSEGSPAHVTLSAGDPGADAITSWSIDWGDGSAAETFNQVPTNIAHNFSAPGIRDIIVSVTDEDGVHPTTFPKDIAAVPHAPTGLFFHTTSSAGWIELQWADTSNWETGFEIEADLGGGSFSRIATVPANTTTYLATGFDLSTAFRVRAVSDAAVSAYSNIAGQSWQDTVAPSMSTVTARNETEDSIELVWNAVGIDAVGFEISRDGQRVATVTGSKYTDVGLKPGTTYQYSVRAFDQAWNFSAPQTASRTTQDADIQPPTAATALQYAANQITWSGAIDNRGVAGYEVYRNGLRLGIATDTSYPADKGYTYRIVAFDVAGNYSTAAEISTPAADPQISLYLNESPNQFIPTDYENYFYDTLTRALRDRIVLLGNVAPAPARRWFDLGADDYFLIGGGNLRADAVSFDDTNHNGRWEPSEPAWKDSNASGVGTFGSEDQVVSGSPISGTHGTSGSIWYKNRDGDEQKDSDEPYFLYDIALVKGVSGGFAYRDLSGDGQWNSDEPVWRDDGNSIYDDGETIVYHQNRDPAPGDWGKSDGLYHLADGTDGIVWKDRTTFQQDLAAFYPKLEDIIPRFQMGTDCTCLRHWTKANILEAIGLARPGLGTATVAANNSSKVQINPEFVQSQQLQPGAAIKFDGKWHDIVGVEPDGVLISPGADEYSGSYEIVDWTRIPQNPDEGFSYEPGRYKADSRGRYGLVFPEHLEELTSSLNQLLIVARYPEDTRIYTETESDRFISVAQNIADLIASLFGSDADASLRALIESGAVSPGAPFLSSHFSLLGEMILDVDANVRLRDGNDLAYDEEGYARMFGNEGLEFLDGPATVPCEDSSPWQALDNIERLANDIRENRLWTRLQEHITGGAYLSDAIKKASALHQPAGHATPLKDDISSWHQPEGGECNQNNTVYEIGAIEDFIYQVIDLTDEDQNVTEFVPSAGWICPWTYSVTNPPSQNPLHGNAPDDFRYMASDGMPLPEGKGLGDTWTRWHYDIDEARNAIPWPEFSDPPCDPQHSITRFESNPLEPPPPAKGIYEEHNTGTVVHYCQFGPNGLEREEFNRDASVHVVYYDQYWYINFYVNIPITPHPLPTRPRPEEADPIDHHTIPDVPLTTITDALGDLGDTTKFPDTNADDIVEVDADFTSFGNDTGFMYFHPQRQGYQTVVPLFTDDLGAIPIHAYLSSGYPIPSTYWTGSDADENGIPYAYSLDTRARADVLLNTPNNHRKQIEIIRPRGNSVVFDFSYIGNSHFSDIGYPRSYGGREEKRLYVLRDLTPNDDEDLNYKLLFPSGVSHIFGGANGKLVAVSQSEGASIDVTQPSSGFALDWEQLRGMPTESDDGVVMSPQYDLDLVWKNGQIHDITYTTRDGSQAINTLLQENGVAQVTKTAGPAHGTLNSMDGYSYTRAGSGYEIHHGDATIKCMGTCDIGTMTIRTTVDGVPGYQEVITELNDAQLIKTQTVRLVTDSTDKSSSISYHYVEGDDRYAQSYAPKWGKVDQITKQLNGSGDDSWQKFEYDNLGRLSKIITPLNNNSPESDGSQNRVQEFLYDSTASGFGRPAEPAALMELPRTIISSVKGFEIDREYRRYSQPVAAGSSAYPGPITIRQTRLPGAPWTGPSNTTDPTLQNIQTKIIPHALGPADTISTTGGMRYSTTRQTDDDGDLTQLQVIADSLGPGGVVLQTSTSRIDAFGTILKNETKDVDSKLPISKFSADVDSFGRIEKLHDYITGRTSKYENYSWFGPQLITDFDGVQTGLTYTPSGQIETEETLGIRTEYEFDAAGNVIEETRSGQTGNQLSVSTSARFDAIGRPISFTDENSHTTTFQYDTETDYSTTTVTYPDQTTYIETKYLDGSPRSIEGSAAYPVEFNTGIDGQYTQDGDDFNYGLWTSVTQHSASGSGPGITTKTFYNPLGQAYRTERPAPTGTAKSVTRFDAFARPTRQIDFDGVHTAFAYDARDQLTDVILDANQNGQLDPGERRTSYSSGYTRRDGRPVFQSQSIIRGDANNPDSTYTSQQSLDGQDTWENANGMETHSVLRYLNTPGSSLLTIFNPDGTKSELSYADRTLASQKDLGIAGQVIRSASFTPDSLLRTQSVAGAFGQTITDRLNNGLLNKTTFADGRSVEILDRDLGTDIPTSIRRADGKLTERAIDDHGQLFSQWGAGVTPASFDRSDHSGDLTTLTTFGSLTAETSWDYSDTTGFLSGKKFAGSVSPDIAYLYNNNLQLEHISRPGSNLTLGYNESTGDWSASNYNNSQLSYTVNDRDVKGRIKQLTQSVGGNNFVTNYTYTALDQLQKETLPQLAGAFNTFYDYYGTGEASGDASPGAARSVAIRNDTQDLVKQSYSYNEGGKRLHSITAGGSSFIYDYRSGTGLVESVSGPGGMVTTRGYEPNTGRLSSITVTTGNQLRYSAGYEYNDNDQRIAADIILVFSDGSSKTEHWEYDYDDQDQLIFAASYDESGGVSQEFDYDFDEVGNDLDFEPNALNQYTYNPDTDSAITYDERGNLTFDGTFHYSYNPQDRVIEARDNQHRATYGYDAQGRRVWRKSYQWDSTLNGGNGGWNLQQTLTFAYDGWRLMGEFELQGDGSQRLIRSYTWGLDVSGSLEGAGGIGGLLSVTTYAANGTPTTYKVVHDGNGNVVQLIDSAGVVAATYEYGPFGKLLSAQGPAADACPIGFSDKRRDELTGDADFGLRELSTRLGRWNERDPIEESGGLNLYAYVKNDPVEAVDPFGLSSASQTQPGIVQLWRGIQATPAMIGYFVSHPKESLINLGSGVKSEALKQFEDFAYSRSTPDRRLAFDHGRFIGSIDAGASYVIGFVELPDTGKDAIEWLVLGTHIDSGNAITARHALSRGKRYVIDGFAENYDDRAFDVGSAWGHADFEIASAIISVGAPGSSLASLSVEEQLLLKPLRALPKEFQTVAIKEAASQSAARQLEHVVNDVSGVLANKRIGDATRDIIAFREGGQIEKVFVTTGGLRRIDVVVIGEKVAARESKVGFTRLTSRVRQEVARDYKLLKLGGQRGGYDSLVWEFTRSPLTGEVGPSLDLLKTLQRLKIPYVIN